MADGKMNEDENELRHALVIFASEVVNFLMINSGLEPHKRTNYQYFTTDIGDAILAISNVFRRDFRILCHHVSASLINIERFKEYCDLIPLKETKTYFYNYLKRIALMYEMALFCHINNYSRKDDYRYFKVVCTSIVKYPIIDFFDHIGGWSSLKLASAFIANIGRPLELILLPEYVKDEKILTFVDVVEKLHKDYLYSGNTTMLDSPEKACLEELKTLFKANVSNKRSKRKVPAPRNVDPEEIFQKEEKKIMKDYLNHCIRKTEELKETSFPNILHDRSKVENSEHLGDPKTRESQQDDNDLDSELKRIAECNAAKFSMKIFNKLFKLEISENETPFVNNQQNFDISCTEENDSFNEDKSRVSPEVDSTENGTDNGKLRTDNGIPRSSKISIESYQGENKILHEVSYCSTSKHSDFSPETDTAETGCSRTQESSDGVTDLVQNRDIVSGSTIDTDDANVKWNFIVPRTYMKHVGNLEECECLYVVRIFPISRKKKLNERLKTILDTNIINRNYKVLSSGDVFVSPPDSSKEAETLLIFVDSNPNDGIYDDILGLICIFKKSDVDYEEKSYQLRPRDKDFWKYVSTETERKESSTSENVTKENKRLKLETESVKDDGVVYADYLVKFYKKYFPLVLDNCIPLFFCTSKKHEACFNLDCADQEKNTHFLVSAHILAKRKVEIMDSDETEDIRGVLLDGLFFQDVFLPLSRKKELDSYIRNGLYHPIVVNNSVYLVGSKVYDSRVTFADYETWLLFYPEDIRRSAHKNINEMLKVYISFKEAILSWTSFPAMYCSCFYRLEKDFMHSAIVK